ncbi:MAG: TrkA family potassium uptake protein [Desulfobacterales bacterium]|nr:TrkA family potassium uptake protein [Desulfobacterales bacterium]
MAKKLTIGVIGLGKFGFRFGQTLVELGQEVLGIDSRPEQVRRAQSLLTQVYEADAMDVGALKQLGFPDMTHVLVSVGSAITASSMLAMHLIEMGVDKVWVKAVDNDHARLLKRIGVEHVILPEDMAARQLAHRLATPGFIEYLPFDKGVALKELIVEKWGGQSLRQIDLTNQFKVQVIAVKKPVDKEFRYIPGADDLLETGDRLVVLGRTERLAKLVS